MAIENIIAYTEEINETLEWMRTPRTEHEFDDWIRNEMYRKMSEPSRFKPVCGDSYILGSIPSGVGVDSWGGRLDLVQHLMGYGFIDAVSNDGVITYRTIKDFDGENQ